MRVKGNSSGGFVLIIVVALLGVMAYMALQLVETAQLASRLGDRHLFKVKSRLYARCGLEKANALPFEVSHSSEFQIGEGSITPGGDRCQLDFRDAAGCIHLNDGIASGRAQLGITYDATALEPYTRTLVHSAHVYLDTFGGHNQIWLDPNPGPGVVKVGDRIVYNTCGMETWIQSVMPDGSYLTYDLDPCGEGLSMVGWEDDALIERVDFNSVEPQHVSGQANLRLRRLLNAYGNAHRYLDFLNTEPPLVPTGNMAGFTFTATLDAPVIGQKMPPTDGLGDFVIASRPSDGFRSWSQVAALVDEWGRAYLNQDYLAGHGFFELCRPDFTLWAVEDDRIQTLKGPFVQPWKHVDRSSSAFNVFQIMPFIGLDESPPDFSASRWVRDITMPIHPGAASRLVLAAMLYACADVPFLVESSQTTHGKSYSADENTCDSDSTINLRDHRSARPRLGLAGCVFQSSRMTENGDLSVAQPNRLMSLRDALLLSKGLKGLMAPGGPMTPWEFQALLRSYRLSGSGSPYERAEAGVAFNDHPDFGFFTQDYVERALPHLLSPITRIPGFLGAPSALLTPLYETTYAQVLDPDTLEQPTDVSNAFLSPAVLRTVSDFVPRRHLPKLDFTPSGLQISRSTGRVLMADGAVQATTTISAASRMYRITQLRTQSDFESHTDSASTSTSIRTGPNCTALAGGLSLPDDRIGMVGLKDVPDDYSSWSVQPQIAMDFSGNVLPNAGRNPPQSPTITQDVSLNHPSANYDIYTPQLTGTLANSRPEVVEPLLSRGGKGGDLPPCGGINLSSLGHGPWTSKGFEDSLYWRLYGASPNPIWNPALPTGKSLGKGFVHMWVRIPTGPQYPSDFRPLAVVTPSDFARGRRFKHVLAHMRAWERAPNSATYPHASGYGWNPVDIYLFYSFNTVTKRHEIHASYNSLYRRSFPGGAGVWQDRYAGADIGYPMLPFVDDDTLAVQDDQMTMPYPFMSNNYAEFLKGGSRVFLKRAILKDLPENGPGTWHLVSMGWNISRQGTGALTGGADWSVANMPLADKFWLRVHDASHVDVYNSSFHVSTSTGELDRVFGGFPRNSLNNTNINGVPTLGDGNMVFSLGEVQIFGQMFCDWAAKSDHPYRLMSHWEDSGVPFFLPMWRLDSCLDNVRVAFGGVPSLYNGFNAPGYTSGASPQRYPVSSEPHWALQLPCPVGSRILRIATKIYAPADSGDATVQGPNVPRIDMNYQSMFITAVQSQSADGSVQYFKNLHSAANHRIRLTYRNRNNKNNLLDFGGSDDVTDIPWIAEVSVVYRPPGSTSDFLHFELHE